MAESWTLDSLALHDATFQIRAEGVDLAPPKAKPEWIGAADSEWQVLVREPNYENRTIVLPMMIAPQTTKDLMFDKIGQIRDKLAKASKYPGGIVLAWTAHGSARTINFDVLAGEVSEFVYDHHANLQNRARLTITLTAKPFWYGTETLTSTTSSSTPFVTAEITNAVGDIPALGRLIVTDTATQSRRHVEWGLEGPLTYNAATSLIIESDSMVTAGFAGTGATRSGAYDPGAAGNSVIRFATSSGAAAIAGVGNLAHVGSFRVKARVYDDWGTASFRLAWRAGDGPMMTNAWAPSSGSGWRELDLGMITIPAVVAGTQRWTGQVEAKSSNALATVDLDYLTLVPVGDGYGKARATYAYTPGVVIATDNFDSTTAGNPLSGRVAPAGGTWDSSWTGEDATDFVFDDDFGTEHVSRTAVSGTNGRVAILGSTPFADTEVQVDTRANGTGFTLAGQNLTQALVARFTDLSNYLRLELTYEGFGLGWTNYLRIVEVVAGTPTTLASTNFAFSAGEWHALRLIVYASGRVTGIVADGVSGEVGATIASLDTQSPTLATGGTLDDGLAGFYDLKTGAAAETRHYENFRIKTPASEPVVIYSGRNMQVRHDDTIRQDSTGTYTGRPQTYRPAGRFLVPVGTSRVLVKARRNDVDTAADSNVADATQIQVGYTPRGLVVPRA